jgi:hypothetical protein
VTAEDWAGRSFSSKPFGYAGLPQSQGEAWLNFCSLAVSIVACLWPPEGEKTWATKLDGNWVDDAPGLFACFTKAMKGRPEPDLAWFSSFRDGDAVNLFAGLGTLQLLSERAERLRRVATALLERWDGQATHLLEAASWDGPSAVDLLAETVPGYRDRVESEFGELAFDKLAHLCVALMASRSPKPIGRLETFPVYPDYMLPRALRHLGVLRYDEALADAVDSRMLIDPGSNWEVAIRWATVHAAERLRQELNNRGNPVTSPQLDYVLWASAVLGPDASKMGEHHRTLTLAY